MPLVVALLWLVVVVELALSSVATDNSLYSLKAVDINYDQVSLDIYNGKVLLVVNVASECGYTDYNYKQLVMLQEQFYSQGLRVLAFPCNQFGQQEPADNAEILSHVTELYNVNFKIFSKTNVQVGVAQSPVYQYLMNVTGSTPQWNFCKYLVNQSGRAVQYFTQLQDFTEIELAVNYLISKNLK